MERKTNTSLELMVRQLKEGNWITNDSVEDAMREVDRTLFVLQEYTDQAYHTAFALPIGHDQTISAANVIAAMLCALDMKPGMKVLEIGSGSGYVTALLAAIVGKHGRVISIEIVPELSKLAKTNFAKIGWVKKLGNTVFIEGDGSEGYLDGAPYDRIILSAAIPSLDDENTFIKQLKADGRMVAPVGGKLMQELLVYDKETNKRKSLIEVAFVLMTGREGWKEQI